MTQRSRKEHPVKEAHKKLSVLDFSPRQLFIGSLVLFMLSVVTLAIATFITSDSSIKNAKPQNPFALGKSVSQGLATVTVSNVRKSAGTQPFVAPEGEQYVTVELTVKNNSDSAINITPTNDTYIKRDDGTISYMTMNNLAHPFRAGALPPGEQIKGDISYIVSTEGSYRFFVDSIWSGGVLPFSLR